MPIGKWCCFKQIKASNRTMLFTLNSMDKGFGDVKSSTKQKKNSNESDAHKFRFCIRNSKLEKKWKQFSDFPMIESFDFEFRKDLFLENDLVSNRKQQQWKIPSKNNLTHFVYFD